MVDLIQMKLIKSMVCLTDINLKVESVMKFRTGLQSIEYQKLKNK